MLSGSLVKLQSLAFSLLQAYCSLFDTFISNTYIKSYNIWKIIHWQTCWVSYKSQTFYHIFNSKQTLFLSMDTSHSVCLNVDWLIFLNNRIKFWDCRQAFSQFQTWLLPFHFIFLRPGRSHVWNWWKLVCNLKI